MRQYPWIFRYGLGHSGQLGIRLCGLWLAGAWIGSWLCGCMAAEFGQLLHQAAAQGAVGLGGLGISLIPLALTLAASSLGWRWPVWLLCGLRGMLLGCGLGWLRICFGQAAGMLAVLLLFSLLLSSPVLLWYWWRCLHRAGEVRLWEFLWCLTALTVIWAMDRWMIGPFLERVVTM